MILDKWKERRHVEVIRNLLKVVMLGFIISTIIGIAIGYNVQGLITIVLLIILFISDKYFSSIRALEVKYKKAIIGITHWMNMNSDRLNTDNVFMMQKYDEVKKLCLTILDDTEISKDEYYGIIVFVFILIPIFTIYNFYRFIMHQIPGYIYGIIMLVLAAIFIEIVLNIKGIIKIKNDTKEFIKKEGWDKEWGR